MQTMSYRISSFSDMKPSSTATPTNVTRKKSSSKKAARNGRPNTTNDSYEHHLEKWLENTSKMNFDYNNLDGNWPFMNAPNAFQQPTNRKGNSHLLQQYGSNDPISLPSHIVSFALLRCAFMTRAQLLEDCLIIRGI